MTLEEAIFSRRTVRQFLPDPVPKEIIEKVIQAGIAAPSSLNSQPWQYVVVAGKARDDLVNIIKKYPAYLADILALFPKEITENITEEFVSAFAKNLGDAPIIIFITTPKKTNRYAHKIDLLACGAAVQNMQLVAWSLGLGTVCLTSALWVESEITSYFNLKDREIVTVIPIGYRANEPNPVARDADVVTWMGF